MEKSEYAKRIEAVKNYLQQNDIECALVIDGFDVGYLTGLPKETGVAILILSKQGNYVVTDNRYEIEAKEACPDFEVLTWTKGVRGTFETALVILGELAPQTLAFSFAEIPYSYVRSIQEKLPSVTLKDSDLSVKALRARKSAEEIELIETACKISMRSFYALLDKIKPGVTEKYVSDMLEAEFRSHGGDGYCFTTIVASGPNNGALPHASVSDRKIEKGDFVTIDFGTAYKGYCSDITRTVTIGKPNNPELLRMFEAVSTAKEQGAKALHAGTCPMEIHNTLKAVMDEYGYVTPHGFGHSFGLQIHEYPFITLRDETPYPSNCVTTIEPGIYIPGTGGVRQEDDFLIVDGGAKRLTTITDYLIEL